MECNIEEAVRAKETAEKKFAENDFAGAKKYAIKAQKLNPGLEGISQMLATFDVYVASQVQINGETDFYSILGLNPVADDDTVKKQYRKLAVMLHPDKNRTVGAEGAFKLVSDAWTLLSDNVKRTSYDLRRNRQSTTVVNPTNSAVQNTKVKGCLKSNKSKLRTFWTVCTSCRVQYEYLRKYVNKRLSCKNCRRTFVAVETVKPPETSPIPFCSWSVLPENVHGSHGFNGLTYIPASTIVFTGTGFGGFHSGVGYEYPNMAFQWSPFPGTPAAGFAGVHGPTTGVPSPSPAPSAGSVHQSSSNNVKRHGEKIKAAAAAAAAAKDKDLTENGSAMGAKASIELTTSAKSDRHEKKRKTNEGTSMNGYQEEKRTRTVISETKTANGVGNLTQDAKKFPSTGEAPNRRCSAAPAFDARQLLIDKARTEIRKKLEEMKSAAAAAAAKPSENSKAQLPARGNADQGDCADESQTNQPGPGSISISVPDPDFHDFDKDRLEECFKPKQVWAMYDEEDGMPRLYCLVRQVISVKPFKIRITRLNSKSDSEFGLVNWVDSGFVKSCGHFRAWDTEDVELVNIFSHILPHGAKAGRGGCIRIFPKRGDIWAVYRNWSPDWNRTTPDEVRHQYEMVEVLDDYNEELGICVTPLIKLDGFKTVYQKNSDQKAVQWIPRREMLRFSHQVPSWLLQGEVSTNLPVGCWDLDPAATPEELLHGAGLMETRTIDDKPEPVQTNWICEM
ncbi:uncharacterized protein LOC122640713 [Telopea speciosissima]|uniref:uncharacterized protein LOC122640713 n=1 Tax=Telopea speciosissima TaxID=54955 RepID=UPI001CC42D4F|nr:uncharacterized protein LOC122640713 [Telopea speciosissima]